MNLSTYLKDIQKELKLTTFPSQTVVVNFTLFVVIFTAVMAVYLGALDLGFGEAILKGINSAKETTSQITDINAVIATTTDATSTFSAPVIPASATSVPTNILLK
jgi:preprotein translocase SecE subunit